MKRCREAEAGQHRFDSDFDTVPILIQVSAIMEIMFINNRSAIEPFRSEHKFKRVADR